MSTGLGGWFYSVAYATVLVVYLYTLTVSLIGTERAAHGTPWTYPVNLWLFR